MLSSVSSEMLSDVSTFSSQSYPNIPIVISILHSQMLQQRIVSVKLLKTAITEQKIINMPVLFNLSSQAYEQ